MVDWNPPGAPPILPVLFITVACGACSGFHCLVGSGTTSKQLARERDAKSVGYGSMLTEGFLAVIVIAACAGGIGLAPTKMGVDERWINEHTGTWFGDRPAWWDWIPTEGPGTPAVRVLGDPGVQVGPWIRTDHGPFRVTGEFVGSGIYRAYVDLAGSLGFHARYASWQSAGSLASTVGAFVEGGANFLAALAIPRHIAIALMAVMVASFAATTMDTSCRLQRYVVQELARVALVGRRSKHKTGSCPGCGYDLAGIDPERAVTHDPAEAHTRCPECNTVSTVEQRSTEGVTAAAIARASWMNPIRWLTTTHGATMFAVVTACALAFVPPAGQAWSLSNAGMGAMMLWPLFGCVNQLLAGFAFVVIIAWLRVTGRPWWFAAVPGVFMLVVPAWALVWQAFIGDANSPSWVAGAKWPLVVTGVIALALELWLVAEALVRWPKSLAASPLGGEAGSSGARAG